MNPVRELDAANPHVQFDEREVETGLLIAGTAPPLDSTMTITVVVDRSDAAKATFNYSIDFSEQLSSEQHAKLMQIATTCPVHNTLSREITFRQGQRRNGAV